MAFVAAFLLVLMAAPSAFAAQTTIDWSLGQSFASLATKSYTAGDTLLFNYASGAHTVLVVSKDDYDKCNTGSPIQSFTQGNTQITLKEGTSYYICGIPGHCSGGMKLTVTTKASGSSTPATPTTPSTPSSAPAPSDSGSTTPSSSTPSSPAPKDSNAASGLSSPLMFGVPLVLGTLFAFMS